MIRVTLQITWDNSIDDTGTNYIHTFPIIWGKIKFILLPQTIQDTFNKILWSSYHGSGTAFIIWNSAVIDTVFPFINILYPCLPVSVLSYLDY